MTKPRKLSKPIEMICPRCGLRTWKRNDHRNGNQTVYCGYCLMTDVTIVELERYSNTRHYPPWEEPPNGP